MMNFLKQLFPNCHSIHIEKVIGGRNNRGYKILIDNDLFFLKHYHFIDGIERLNAEYLFLKHADEQQCHLVCQPIARDSSRLMAVFEFISGDPFINQQIGKFEITQALEFLSLLNKNREKSTIKLPNAREACFSLAEHLFHVEKRLQLLHCIPCKDDIDRQALHFIKFFLLPTWHCLKDRIYREIKKLNLDKLLSLSQKNRIISPSDFGFHNALKLQNDQIKFIDFEYAGWDDPAKLIADFFNQIEIPVSPKYLNFFCDNVVPLIEDKAQMRDRALLLLPLYRIKWICIVLNYFLPKKKLSKNFVFLVTEEVKMSQLKKAKKLLNSFYDFDDWIIP